MIPGMKKIFCVRIAPQFPLFEKVLGEEKLDIGV